MFDNAKQAGQFASGAIAAEPAPMSEIDREVHRLLCRAEELEQCVAHLLVKTEKVTRQEPGTKGETPAPIAQVPATQMARCLDNIGGRLQTSINLLQSLIPRIEL